MHKEAGTLLSLLLKKFDHHHYVPDPTEVLPEAQRIVDAHLMKKIREIKREGILEPPTERKQARIRSALIEIIMVSFKHQLAFADDWIVDLHTPKALK